MLIYILIRVGNWKISTATNAILSKIGKNFHRYLAL